MRQLEYLQDVRQADPDLACWLIYEQLEFLHADGRLDDEAWQLVCALMREHESLTAALRAREPN